tara:strand:+ start:234 stop:605 length:372 start_codon:yes stop_codon:yes gene_type:complete
MIDKLTFNEYYCKIVYTHYADGNKCIALVDATDGSPVAKCTVNIPDLMAEVNDAMQEAEQLSDSDWDKIKHEIVFIKDYSENEGMYQAMKEAGMIYTKWADANVGYTSVPVTQLTPLALEGWK